MEQNLLEEGRHGSGKTSSPSAVVIGPLPTRVSRCCFGITDALSDYTPHLHGAQEFDFSHLRLGIAAPGIYAFMEEIGYIWHDESTPQHNSGMYRAMKKNYEDVTQLGGCGGWGWKYSDSYERRSKQMGWCNDVAGPVKKQIKDPDYDYEYPRGLLNMTGYDLSDFVRQWLAKEGCEGLSVCEAILTKARFSHLRKYIGRADIFWSHVQQECVFETLASIRQAREVMGVGCQPSGVQRAQDQIPQMPFFWLDYFCLRQLQKDFNTLAVLELVKEIGYVVASISTFGYLKRSFCILELLAAVKGKAVLRISTAFQNTENLSGIFDKRWPTLRALAHSPVNSAAATTRDPEDKHLVDAYIRQAIGFAELDKIVTQAVLYSCYCDACGKYECTQHTYDLELALGKNPRIIEVNISLASWETALAADNSFQASMPIETRVEAWKNPQYESNDMFPDYYDSSNDATTTITRGWEEAIGASCSYWDDRVTASFPKQKGGWHRALVRYEGVHSGRKGFDYVDIEFTDNQGGWTGVVVEYVPRCAVRDCAGDARALPC
jgi:hypothetical protein